MVESVAGSRIEWIQTTVGGKVLPKLKVRNRESCLACGRKLSDPKSKEQGMGPVCWRRWGRPDWKF